MSAAAIARVYGENNGAGGPGFWSASQMQVVEIEKHDVAPRNRRQNEQAHDVFLFLGKADERRTGLRNNIQNSKEKQARHKVLVVL